MENINGVPTVAGWHDDPADPNFIRYSNGRAWTGERVAKDRTLTLKNDNVYRPGGGVGRMPEKKTIAVAPEPVSYQPLTRKERRILENADSPALESMSTLFEDDFEFQTAPSTTPRPYAPGKDEVAKRREIPVIEDTPATAEVSLYDGFEDVFSKLPDPEAYVAEDVEPEWSEDALPSLDMGGTFNVTTSPSPMPEEDSSQEDEPTFLPTLGDSSAFVDEGLPTLEAIDRGEDEPAENEEDEFFTSAVSTETEEDDVEDDFMAVAPIVIVRRSYEAPSVEVKDETKESQKLDDVHTALSPVTPPSATKTKEPQARALDVAVSDLVDEDEEPSFGFTSKLGRSFKKDDTVEPAPVAPIAPRPAPKPEEKLPDPLVDEDDEDFEDEDTQREGIGGRIKSLFGRGRSQEVLDYDYQEDEDKPDASNQPTAELKPELKTAVASLPKAAPSDMDDDADSDEPDEEEPKIKTGIFSSRQDKEDAAVEVELVTRLNSLAKRVASLKQEEIEVLARVEAAKAQEKTLNELIIHAHETHELLDQLAKTRQKEMEGSRDEKEAAHFMELLDSHEVPDVEEETSSESTVALPVIKENREKEDDESEDSPLPELKLN